MFNYTILVGGILAVVGVYLSEGFSNLLVCVGLLLGLVSMHHALISSLMAKSKKLEAVNMGLAMIVLAHGMIDEEQLKEEIEKSEQEAA